MERHRWESDPMPSDASPHGTSRGSDRASRIPYRAFIKVGLASVDKFGREADLAWQAARLRTLWSQTRKHASGILLSQVEKTHCASAFMQGLTSRESGDA